MARRGQWGVTQDDYGRLFYNYENSSLHADLIPEEYTRRNPHLTPETGRQNSNSGLNVNIAANGPRDLYDPSQPGDHAGRNGIASQTAGSGRSRSPAVRRFIEAISSRPSFTVALSFPRLAEIWCDLICLRVTECTLQPTMRSISGNGSPRRTSDSGRSAVARGRMGLCTSAICTAASSST